MDFTLTAASAVTLKERQFDGVLTALLATVGEPTKVVRLMLGTGEVGDRLVATIRAYVQSRTRHLPGGARVLHANAYGPREFELWLDGPALKPVLNGNGHVDVKSDSLVSASTTPVGENPHLLKSIEELNLSVRAYNGLKNARVATVRQLINESERSLSMHKNFGRKSINEIKEKLEEFDLTLAEAPALGSAS